MPFKMHKIMFFPEKTMIKFKKICLRTLPLTRNTFLLILFGLKSRIICAELF